MKQAGDPGSPAVRDEIDRRGQTDLFATFNAGISDRPFRASQP